MGPGTIAALEVLLVDIARLPDALFCSATDANGPGDRFADRHKSLARKFGVPFERLRPLIEGGDWNEALRAQSSAIVWKPKETLVSEMISPTKAAAAADFDDESLGASAFSPSCEPPSSRQLNGGATG
jgi:hypothetical protein